MPSLTCQSKWPCTSLPVQLTSAKAETIERYQPQKGRVDEEEGEEIMTVEAEEVEVEVLVATLKSKDGPTVLTQKTTPSHSPTMK